MTESPTRADPVDRIVDGAGEVDRTVEGAEEVDRTVERADEPATGDPGDGHPEAAAARGVAALRARSRSVRVPSRSAEYDARRRLPDLLWPVTHLGDHADLAVWWSGVRGTCPAPPPASPRVVVLAADHGIAVRGVSALPLGWTGVAARRLAAAPADIPVDVVDVDVAGARGPRSRPLDTEPALDPADLDEAVDRGARLAAEAADHDIVGLAAIGVAGTTTAAALLGSLLGLSPVAVVTRGSGIDDTAWMRKTAAVRDGLRRSRIAGLQPGAPAADHLRELGGLDVAVAVGFLVEAAALRLPVVVDGPVAAVAALLAQRLSPSSRHWWLGVDPAADAIAARAWSETGVARVRTTAEGAGLGAALAVASVRSAARVLAAATADQAARGDDSDAAPEEARRMDGT